jgi:hypothetical protein
MPQQLNPQGWAFTEETGSVNNPAIAAAAKILGILPFIRSSFIDEMFPSQAGSKSLMGIWQPAIHRQKRVLGALHRRSLPHPAPSP